MPWLTTIILFPIVASLLIPFIPDKEGKGRPIRWFALVIGLIDFSLIVYAFYTQYDLSYPGLQLVESYPWVPQIGLNWSVGADGLSMPLVVVRTASTTAASSRRSTVSAARRAVSAPSRAQVAGRSVG